MSDWTEGYVADIAYTYGYYGELNPSRVRLAFLQQGLACPEFGTACELGFGQGLSTNLHAAASVTQWHGTDFNPAQAGFAQELAAASGSGAKLYDEAFADFCNRPDLPDFDFIGLHGIWSWISDENRQVIVDFIRKKLKVGGVLYISYNTLPGWAAFAPMRHLLTEHAEVMGAEGGGIVNRIDGAMAFADKLLQTKPAYARANPQVADRLKKMQAQNRHYLAHEYFNRDWQPMHFATMAEWLQGAKVQFACSAHYFDVIDAVNLSADQQAFLKDIPDTMFRQSVRDFMVNQQFRKDYWVKGARKITDLERIEGVRRQKVILTTPRVNVPMKISALLGEVSLQESIYGPLLDSLSDHKVHAFSDLERALKGQNIQFNQLFQAVILLVGAGHIGLVQEDSAQASKAAKALNMHLMHKARSSTDVAYLASPILGGGMAVGRFQQLFLLGLKAGKKTPPEWAQFVWEILQAQGQRVLKEGKLLENEQDNLAELTRLAQLFADQQLPIFKGLQIA